jgi:hypothetical protein
MIHAIEIIAADVEGNQDVSLAGHVHTTFAAWVFLNSQINKRARLINSIFLASWKLPGTERAKIKFQNETD